MVKSLLPPLNEDHAVPLPASSGKWVVDENSILGRVGNGLKDITFEQEVEDLISIPDVWARVTIVKNALFDDKHASNNTIRGEWRGLMALFALMPYHNHTIETVPVDLKALQNMPYQVAPNEEGVSGNFAKVLTLITPETSICKGQNWNEIGIIKLDGIPIGLLVPNTIVCPATDYSESIKGAIDWFQGGKLIDPCQAANIQSEQFRVLIRFLNEMIIGIQQEIMSDKLTMDGILGELESYKKACEKRLAENTRSTIEVTNFRRFNIALRFPQQPIYPLLQNIYEFDTGGQVAFDTMLKVRPELNSLVNGIILIDSEIPNGIGEASSDVRLWNTTTVDTLITDKRAKKRLEKEIAADNYLFLHPNELFTKKLCLPYGSEQIINHKDRISKPYLFPFNPIILTFMTPTQINNNFDIKDNGNSSYTVSLSLNLFNHSGEKKDYVIRHDYKKEDIERRLEFPVAAHTWPNFIHNSWNHYFMLYACNLQTSVALRSLFSIKGLIQQFTNVENPDQKLKLLNKLKDISIKMSNRLPIEETTNLTELHLTEQPPEALICDGCLDLDLHEFVPSQDREPLGIILTGKPEEVMINNDYIKFGIDFGTTNTCAYMRINEDVPIAVNFANRLYSPFSEPDQKELLTWQLRDFVPSREVQLPFQTISRDRNLGKKQGDIPHPLPLWSSIIYFVGDMRDGLNDILKPLQRELHFNLKWSTAEADRERIEIYLSQVILECIAEGLSRGADIEKISWNFSYPEAFTPKQLKNFRQLFQGGLRKALEPLNPGKQSEVTTTQKSESYSSALYFASFKEVPFADSVITIDIGGGTSDISIWQNRNLLWRNSVTVAGQHILTNFLNENFKLIESLSSHDRIMQEAYDNYLVEIKKKDNPNALRNAIEVIVNSASFAEAISNRFHIVDGQDTGRNLRLIAELALAGLLFYAGQIIKHLHNKELYKSGKSNQFSICLGGRASLLYKAIITDKEDQTGLCDLFIAASNGAITKPEAENVTFIFTKDPKHEVSHGLLVDQKGISNLDTSLRNFDVLLGEDIDVGGKVVKFTETVNSLNIDEDWRAINLTNIKSFSELLNEKTGIVFEVTRQIENMIISKINTNLVTSQENLQDAKKDGIDYLSEDMKGESSIIEPPFIVAIKEILERISKKEINILSKNR